MQPLQFGESAESFRMAKNLLNSNRSALGQIRCSNPLCEGVDMRSTEPIPLSFRTQQFVLLAAQEGSFRKAARILDVSPSLLIRSIDKLEADLGAQLFIRTHRGFSMTNAGTLFLRELQEANDHIERAWNLARRQSQIEKKPLRIGYSPYIHSRLVAALERFRLKGQEQRADDSYPTPHVVLKASYTLPLVQSVLQGKLDAAFGMQPITEEELWVKPISREGLCVCMSKNHRLAKQPSVTARDLDGEMIFMFPRSAHPSMHAHIVEYIESTGAQPVLREVLSFTHAVEFAAWNFGIALLPYSASRHSHLKVVFKPIRDKLLWIETALFARHDRRFGNLQEFMNDLLWNLERPSLPS